MTLASSLFLEIIKCVSIFIIWRDCDESTAKWIRHSMNMIFIYNISERTSLYPCVWFLLTEVGHAKLRVDRIFTQMIHLSMRKGLNCIFRYLARKIICRICLLYLLDVNELQIRLEWLSGMFEWNISNCYVNFDDWWLKNGKITIRWMSKELTDDKSTIV